MESLEGVMQVLGHLFRVSAADVVNDVCRDCIESVCCCGWCSFQPSVLPECAFCPCFHCWAGLASIWIGGLFLLLLVKLIVFCLKCYFICNFMFVCRFVHVSIILAEARRGQGELQTIVTCLMWALGTELQSSTCLLLSLLPGLVFYYLRSSLVSLL